MRSVLAILVLGAALAACAAGTDAQKKGNCPPESIVILNEDTGRYDCIDEAEYEKILDELDEVRW